MALHMDHDVGSAFFVATVPCYVKALVDDPVTIAYWATNECQTRHRTSSNSSSHSMEDFSFLPCSEASHSNQVTPTYKGRTKDTPKQNGRVQKRRRVRFRHQLNSLRSLSELEEYLRRCEVSPSVKALTGLKGGHHLYGQDLYAASKTSGQNIGIDFVTLWENYEHSTQILVQGIERQLAAQNEEYTMRDRQLLGWIVDELRDMTIERFKKVNDEKKALHQGKLEAEEVYDRLQAMDLKGPRTSFKHPSDELVVGCM